jgi:Fe-S oxidoreductase
MLTTIEKILFVILALISIYLAILTIKRITNIIKQGEGEINWEIVPQRFNDVFLKTVSLQTVFRFRWWPSFFHALVAWGFLYYLFVNLGDTLEAFIEDFHFLGNGFIGKAYRFGADILSIAILLGMATLLIRRFIFNPKNLTTRNTILLNPKARKGIKRDSLIVGGFILIHVGSRFIGKSLEIAYSEGKDSWQPFASTVSQLWIDLNQAAIIIGIHITFWLALGTILLFIPYFLYSKHIHLFFAPINYLLKPPRRSIGELSRLDFEDESIEEFGATYINELGWEQIMDSYACIMCYRCQEVCPAYNTGKILSPATLEINKRYHLNQTGKQFSQGDISEQRLTDFAIPSEAIWACTACAACIDICPVGNEPMRDIIDIRRALVLMDNDFPDQLQSAFRGMERTQNPWNFPPSDRMSWAKGLDIPTINQNPDMDILWWVGCAPAIDIRAQKSAIAFARILNAAEINYAVLGELEQCTGDSARRAGNEYLFHEMALANVETLNQAAPGRIVTTCPHCLHTLKNEYQAFGGNYEVIHHTQLINELISDGLIKINQTIDTSITYHDPCFLGRQNNIIADPREVIHRTTSNFKELHRHGRKSFCCGAGGAQMWKEEEEGNEKISVNRFHEVRATGSNTLAVGCPFCMIMLTDAKNEIDSSIKILDIAELVAEVSDEIQ